MFPDISRSFSVYGRTILMDGEGEGKAKSKRNLRQNLAINATKNVLTQ